jgi:Rieske Fe-S protein
MLICPCHGATFDPRHNAQPVAGPTNIPLTELPISIQAGEITLRA